MNGEGGHQGRGAARRPAVSSLTGLVAARRNGGTQRLRHGGAAQLTSRARRPTLCLGFERRKGLFARGLARRRGRGSELAP